MPRPTVRLRLTLLYAGVFLLAGAALLTVSYILVRNNLTADHVTVGDGPADQLRRAIQHEVADDALSRLRVQYALALAAMTALSVLLGWLVAGRALRPLQQITSAARLRLAGHARRAHRTGGSRATSSRSWPTPSTRCSSGCPAPSPASGASWPTRRTSCARR